MARDHWIANLELHQRWPLLEPALALMGMVLAGPCAATLLVGRGDLLRPSLRWLLTAAGVWLVAVALWGGLWLFLRSRATTSPGRRASLPFLPVTATGPLLVVAYMSDLANHQLAAGAGRVVLWYLAGWVAAGLIVAVVWSLGRPTQHHTQSHTSAATVSPSWTATPAIWAVAVPVIAVVAMSYWNGALLDPLQYRGFPDFVTQIRGARAILAGQLPYDPSLEWLDVNLPPVTLVALFAPFTLAAPPTDRLLFFWLNHLAFAAALLALWRWLAPRSPGNTASPIWMVTVLALAATFQPWHDSQRLGQPNGIVLLFLTLTLASTLHRRDHLAGVWLALAIIVKPSSALLIIYYLLAGRWRLVATSASMGLAVLAVTWPWAGWDLWTYYLTHKAPLVLAGTAQQSNVAILALHARLFLGKEWLSTFHAMPPLPAAAALTRTAQALGLLLLIRVVQPSRPALDRVGAHLEFALALVLSLALTGHAWQSYVTWALLAFWLLAYPAVWGTVPPRLRWPAALGAIACYVGLSTYDVAVFRALAGPINQWPFLASLPNLALLALAGLLAGLLLGHDQPLIATTDERR